MSEIAKGKTLQEAWRLTDDDIAAELGGLPLEKLHCLWRNSAACGAIVPPVAQQCRSNLAATVLQRAIVDYAENPRGDLRDWQRLYQQLG